MSIPSNSFVAYERVTCCGSLNSRTTSLIIQCTLLAASLVFTAHAVFGHSKYGRLRDVGGRF